MDIRNILKDKLFWMLSIALAGIIFVTAINANQRYEAEVEVIFVPKREIVASHMEQVLSNAEHLMTFLSFYDRVLEDNSEIEDGAEELPAAERKDFWNGIIDAQRIEESGIVKIVVRSDYQTEASMIASQSAQSLASVMSRFYDIRTDLDMRIVDGPIIRQVEKMSMILWLVLSLLLGILAGAVLHVAIDWIVKRLYIRKAERRMDFPKMKPTIFPRVSLSENFLKKETLVAAKNVFEFKAEEEAALVPERKAPTVLSREKKASAPANLPIAEDFNFDTIEEEDFPRYEDDSMASVELPAEKPEEIITHEEPSEHLFREATPEEVKERLNKLLSGEMLK